MAERAWSSECPCGRVHGEPSRRRLKACAGCDRIHTAGDVVAIGRFNLDGPTGYRTRGGEIHATREAGQKWLCEHRQTAKPPACACGMTDPEMPCLDCRFRVRTSPGEAGAS